MQGEVQRARVLVVDDEQLNRALCKRLLSAEYDVLEAVDGPSALALLQKQTIDLVLLDVMMPGMNGLEVCGQIKAAAQGFLPVLFLTSLSDQAERNAALHAGGDDFLTKPFDKRELRLRVSAFVRLRRQDAIIREQLDRLRRLQALKDDLVSLVVHDLRNPLAGILAYVEVLRGQPGVEREDLEQLLDSAKRMRTALEEVLQIRMLEEGEIDAKRGPLRMGDVVREAISAAGPQARIAGIDLRFSAEVDPVLQLDRGLVLRAIENLVNNALKYSRRGDAVEIQVRPAAGGALVEVADRGPGVPDEMKDHVFDKFVAVEARNGQARRGFGLGLYLVQLTMAAHGGTARVTDREGGGSVFMLFFPADA